MDDLRHCIALLTERVEILEARAPRPSSTQRSVWRHVQQREMGYKDRFRSRRSDNFQIYARDLFVEKDFFGLFKLQMTELFKDTSINENIAGKGYFIQMPSIWNYICEMDEPHHFEATKLILKHESSRRKIEHLLKPDPCSWREYILMVKIFIVLVSVYKVFGQKYNIVMAMLRAKLLLNSNPMIIFYSYVLNGENGYYAKLYLLCYQYLLSTDSTETIDLSKKIKIRFRMLFQIAKDELVEDWAELPDERVAYSYEKLTEIENDTY